MSVSILIDEQVVQLTGYKRKPEQCRWLKQRGLQFYVNGRGKVVVLLGDEKAKKTPELGVVR